MDKSYQRTGIWKFLTAKDKYIDLVYENEHKILLNGWKLKTLKCC